MNAPDPLISIVIVNYRVPDFLLRTLQSLREADLYDRIEAIVVDNASQDDSRERITSQFPEVHWIGLKNNIGFGKACNVGAQSAHGMYLLLLNPDTLISKNTLSECIDFFSANPDTGIMGPKILNPDGTLQAACRRSFPSPLVAFYRMAGLSRLFPKSKTFGKYNLTYLNPDEKAKVDAVSGSFMCMPIRLFREIGGFDETFFMYGEDLDLCRRVIDKGYSVWYNPKTQIIHFKGKSAEQGSWKARKAFYEAMVIFSRKYQHTRAAFLPNWLIVVGVLAQAAVNFVTGLFKTFFACFVDLFLINIILWAGISLRFQLKAMSSPYLSAHFWLMVFMHVLLSMAFLVMFFYRGVYSKERYSIDNTLVSGMIATILFMTAVFFINSMAFSRVGFALSVMVIVGVLAGWREILPRLGQGLKKRLYSTGTVLIIGSDSVASTLVRNIEADASASISGILWPVCGPHPGEFEGYPVLGNIEYVKQALSTGHVDLLLIATASPWYSYIIEALSSVRVKHLTIRWVPPELFAKSPDKLPDVIPLRDFSV